MKDRGIIEAFGRGMRFTGTVLALLVATEGGASEAKTSSTVATVNGDAVTAREFVESLRRLRSLHEEPAQLRRAALDECVRFKVVQQLAREHGVLTEVSDAALRSAFAAENARRAGAIARQEVIFGPRRLTWEQFRATWLDRVERELSRSLIGRAGMKEPADPNLEYEVVAKAVPEAVAVAKISIVEAVVEKLEPNTPIPIDDAP